jgi:hypothetical protein
LSFSDPSGLNDNNVAYAPWNGPGMYANGGYGMAPYYGGGFGCTIDGFECGTTGIAGIGGLGGNGVAYCPDCGLGQRVGADNQIYDWYATTQRFDYENGGLIFTGADYSLLPTGGAASNWWNGLGLAAGAFFRSPSAIQAANAAKNFGKTLAPDESPIEELWSDHTALDWGEQVSEETNVLKSLLDSYADALDGILSGGNGLTIIPMISPSVMGCAGYGNLPCGNGHATSF